MFTCAMRETLFCSWVASTSRHWSGRISSSLGLTACGKHSVEEEEEEEAAAEGRKREREREREVL